MRTVEFKLDSNDHLDDDGSVISAYELDEDEFRSPKDFDEFVEWAVDMLKRLHSTGDGIKEVVVTSTPVLEIYPV